MTNRTFVSPHGAARRLKLLGAIGSFSFCLVAAVVGVMGLMPTLALAQAVPSTGEDWTTAGGTDQGTRYSRLSQINTSNVSQLREEFAFPTGVKHSHQGSPLVVNRTTNGIKSVTMYIVTPFPNKLIALDVTAPGQPKTLWTFAPQVSSFAEGLVCCDVVNRGAVYGEATTGRIKTGLVVYNLLDGSVVAVNAMTGKQVWRSKVADPWTGETLNTAPIIVKGRKSDGSYSGMNKVIFGSSGSEMGIRGSVRALDLATGKLAWQAFSTGTDSEVKLGTFPTSAKGYAKDRGTNQGVTSWPRTNLSIQKYGYDRGGGSVWTWVTYDPDTHTIFYGTSQPGTFNPSLRPGDNKWGSSIFARDPETGNAKWVYQTMPHDNWDYDASSENTVVDLTINSAPRKTIVNFHKNGRAYVMDRITGRIIQAPAFGFENWSGGGINISTGYPLSFSSGNYTVKATSEGQVTEMICPSAFGVKNFGYSSYSPVNNLFYLGTFNMCMNYLPTKVNFVAGTPFVGADVSMMPSPGDDSSGFPGSIGSDGFMMGEFIAFDPSTGQRAWTIREPKVVWGGATATAGDVVFYGTVDGHFKAVDARRQDDGKAKVLFDVQLECGVVSAPITYLGGDGKQRVAITTGLGWLNGAFGGTGPCPSLGNGEDGEDNETGSSANKLPQARIAEQFAATSKQSAFPRNTATITNPTSGYVHVFKLP